MYSQANVFSFQKLNKIYNFKFYERNNRLIMVQAKNSDEFALSVYVTSIKQVNSSLVSLEIISGAVTQNELEFSKGCYVKSNFLDGMALVVVC